MCFFKYVPLLAWLSVAVVASGCAQSEIATVHVGEPAPAFALKDRNGQIVKIDSLKGQVVLLTFWSTTCGPCIHEIPDLQTLNDTDKARVIAVALDPDGWSSVKPCMDKHQMTYGVVLGNEELFQRYGGSAIPHNVLIDQSQRVVKIYRGAVTKERLEKDIEALKHSS